MKSGSGDDPFEDDAGADGDSPEGLVSGDTASEGSTSTQNEVPPYAIRRNEVKEDRVKVPVWLREENEERLGEVKDEVEDLLGYEVYMTDFKEAVVLRGLENPEAIAGKLDAWGCEYA